MEQRLRALADAGVSIWLDDLSRDRINSGNLADLIENYSVVGVTTNPTIFAAALKNGQAYSEQIGRLKAEGLDVAAVIKELTTDDVRNACDVFDSVAAETEGEDGRVSIEVDPPDLARDTDAPSPRRSSWPRRSIGPMCSSRSRRPGRACRRSLR